MRRRSLFALHALPVLGILALGPVAHAAPPVAPPAEVLDEQSEFDKARNAYRARQYEEADARFLRMLDPEHGTLHDKVIIKQARMYWAASRLALHQTEDATRLFEVILTEDRDYEPDPLAFPTEVVNAFIDTRARLRDKLEAIAREGYRLAAERRAREDEAKRQQVAHVAMLERLAREALVTQPHSRWTALLPFGVGQFQNGQRTAGWIFLAAESALVAGGIATVPIYYVNLADANSTYTLETRAEAQQYLDRANTARYVNLACYGALAATVIAGAIQAEVAFVPKTVRTEPRAIPEDPPAAKPVSPTLSFGAAPLPGREGGVAGATLTLGGRF